MNKSNTANCFGGNPLSLVWLRRDVRLHDHAALALAVKSPEPVQPVFVLDTDILQAFPNKHDRRLTLIVRTLMHLHRELATQGGGLLVLHGRAVEIMPRLARALGAVQLIAAGDVEPATRARDLSVKQQLEGVVPFTLVKDHVLHAAHDVLKEDGTPYKVFTPYARAWRARAASSQCMDERSATNVRYADFGAVQNKTQAEGLPVMDLTCGEAEVLARIGYAVSESEWRPELAKKRLHHFIAQQVEGYKERRDIVGVDGTSRLSPYLRFGILSVRECARAAAGLEGKGSNGAATWMNELIWRDFYSMILAHFPHTTDTEFQSQYVGLKWRWDEADWQRFSTGQTGYPIVDAAIRELLSTGTMHNRARMIVASFLTKDLQMDWRKGEEFFAQHLMDYDLASNVGGWQWAASTGTDAQPYFRIFNPVLQSSRFDPEGNYIRRYVPELAHLPARAIHEPWKAGRPAGYPAPMVDHASVKEKVLTLFKASS